MSIFTCPTRRDMYKLGIQLIKWASGDHCIQEISYTCLFCGVIAPMPHEDHCLHKKAKEYMEKYDDRRDQARDSVEDNRTDRQTTGSN